MPNTYHKSSRVLNTIGNGLQVAFTIYLLVNNTNVYDFIVSNPILAL